MSVHVHTLTHIIETIGKELEAVDLVHQELISSENTASLVKSIHQELIHFPQCGK